MKPDSDSFGYRADRTVTEFSGCSVENRTAAVRAEGSVVLITSNKGARLNDNVLLDLFNFLLGRRKIVAFTVWADSRRRYANKLVDVFRNRPVPGRMAHWRASLLLFPALRQGRFDVFAFSGFELLAMKRFELRLNPIAFHCYPGIFGAELFVIFLQSTYLLIKPPSFHEDCMCPLGGNAVHMRTGTLVEAVEISGGLSIIQ